MIHINRYIDKVAAVESKNLKNLNLTIKEARDLHGDITKLLLALQTMHETSVADKEVQQIEMSGGNWGNLED